MRTACNDDVSNRTLTLVSVKKHHGNSEFLCYVHSGASKHSFNSWALCHRRCARPRIRPLCVCDTGTGGRCSTFVLFFLLFLWLFLFVQVEDGVFVDGVATRGWCISGLVCVGDEELVGVVHQLRLCHSRAKSTPDSQLTGFHADFRSSILFWMWSVAFSAHTTLLLFRSPMWS